MDLDAYLSDIISFWDAMDGDILDREVTEYPGFLIDEMRVGSTVTLIVGLSVDPWETAEHPFFCHRFDISIDGSSSDLRLSRTDFFVDVIRREVTTLTGCTDDVTVLVFSHSSLGL